MPENSVIETKEVLEIPDGFVEAGDLSNEIGKRFMSRLANSIDFHRRYNLKKVYFLSIIRKDPTNLSRINITIKALNKPLQFLRESMDAWEYDYEKEKLTLLWSLPHRTEMKNFLRSPEKYNKDLIHWIKKYIDQEKIDLNDPTARIIDS